VDQPTAPTLTLPDLAPQPVDGNVEAWPRRVWRTYVTDVRVGANARAAVTTQTDRRMVWVFVTAAVALTLNNFLTSGSNPGWAVSFLRALGLDDLGSRLHDAMLVSSHREWNRLAFWSVVTIATYVVPPVLVIRYVLRERVRDYGLRLHGIGRHGATYALLFGIAAPLIVAASFSASFQERYPFFHPPGGSSLWPWLYGWWALYWLQFVALEFFFRGFMVHGLAPRLGWAAIFAMVVPYNMLHFGKPMPEALAAIVGGIVLGTLSLKTRSIWWGAALHISIALTMDVCALVHMGRLL
jgi:membrane protease YdiL (CAAX protease family)